MCEVDGLTTNTHTHRERLMMFNKVKLQGGLRESSRVCRTLHILMEENGRIELHLISKPVSPICACVCIKNIFYSYIKIL